MNTDVLAKARELGDAVSSSNELKRLKDAEVNQNNDADAQLLLTAYTKRYQELMTGLQGREPAPDEIETIKAQMEIEVNKLRQNANILEYIAAREDFEGMMNTINQILSFAISGEESECGSGSCSSCGGGCH